MKTSDKGIEFIKEFEGFESNPYLDAVNVPTIGYGSTRYPDGTRVKMTDKPISEAEAVKLLADTLVEYETSVLHLVEVDLEQHEFDALVSFAYNLGASNLERSTLLKKLNQEDFKGAADEFLKWTRAGGIILPGLVRRREAEKEMFLHA